MDRITRQKIKHDKFVDDVGTAYSYMQAHRKRVIWAVVAGLAAIVVVAGMFVYGRAEESRAQKRLGEAIAIIDTPLESQVAPGAPGPKYKTEQEKIAKAQPIFEEISKNYGGTDAADIADVYLARFFAERGDVAAARPKLEEFLRKHPDHILAAAIKRSLYELRIAGGEAKQAISELERELTDEGSVLPDDVVLALLAHAHEISGNAAKAKEVYQRILNEFPDSPYSIDAQRKLVQG